MTHAAAATPAPHVPRRRPSAPAAEARAGAAFGVLGGGVTLGVAAAVATLLMQRHISARSTVAGGDAGSLSEAA